MDPNRKVMPLGQVFGDAIRLIMASKVWIDHKFTIPFMIVKMVFLTSHEVPLM